MQCCLIIDFSPSIFYIRPNPTPVAIPSGFEKRRHWLIWLDFSGNFHGNPFYIHTNLFQNEMEY